MNIESIARGEIPLAGPAATNEPELTPAHIEVTWRRPLSAPSRARSARRTHICRQGDRPQRRRSPNLRFGRRPFTSPSEHQLGSKAFSADLFGSHPVRTPMAARLFLLRQLLGDHVDPL
jgi:hypothetical protein